MLPSFKIEKLNHILFAVSRGVQLYGQFTFEGCDFIITMNGNVPTAEFEPEPEPLIDQEVRSRGFLNGLKRIWSPEPVEQSAPRPAEEQTDALAKVLEKTIIRGLALREAKNYFNLTRDSLEKFMHLGWVLDGIDLAGVDFTGFGEKFHLYNARGQTFRARGAIFNELDMSDSCFEGWDLTGATIKRCNLKYASFGNCDMTRAKIKNCFAFSTEFGRSILKETVIEDTHLDNAEFANAQILGASFKRCCSGSLELRGAFIQDSTFENFNYPLPNPPSGWVCANLTLDTKRDFVEKEWKRTGKPSYPLLPAFGYCILWGMWSYGNSIKNSYMTNVPYKILEQYRGAGLHNEYSLPRHKIFESFLHDVQCSCGSTVCSCGSTATVEQVDDTPLTAGALLPAASLPIGV